MKVVEGYPPNYNKIKEKLNPSVNMVFTYKDTIYSPQTLDIPNDLRTHEEVHSKQQTDPDEWWERYLTDPDFRLSQELEAYKAQYQYIKKHKGWRRWDYYLHYFAKDLSSSSYGNIISFDDAKTRIMQ